MTQTAIGTTIRLNMDYESALARVTEVLTAASQVGLLLPCNVTVSQVDESVQVSLVDPLAMLGVVASAELLPVAQEARARLERVAAALQK